MADPLRATDVFPQLQNEPDSVYRARTLFNQLPIAVANLGGQVADAYNMAMDTPAKRAARAAAAAAAAKAQTGGQLFPTDFNSPVYSQAETQVAQQLGGPFAGTLATMLSQVRTLGERSNAGKTSSAGAKTPYQITPETRQGIIKNYGFDPWSSPANAARGAAYVLMEQAGAFKGGTNLNDPRVQARAFGGYFGGAKGAANPFSSTYGSADESVGSYVMRTMGQKPGLSYPAVSPFDPQYANMALGEINKAEAASKQPFSVSADIGPMPQAPQPEPTPKTDFSQSDQVLNAMRPVEVSLKEQQQVKWKNFWAGLGKAMSTMPEGAGIGDFFLRLGGGALQGKAAGMEEIQQKQDDYENKLARYQAAVYENDFQKAQITHQELLQDWQANQSWALQKYQAGMNVWLSNAKPQIVGNDMVFTKTTPEGKVAIQGVPINNMVDADFAMKRAQVYDQMFGQNLDANSQVTGVENQIQGQIAMAKAGAVLAGDSSDQEKAAAAAYAPVQAAGFAVDSGAVDQVLGPDETQKLTKSVQTTLVGRGLFPGTKDYSDAFSKMMTQQLAMAAFASPQLMNKLTQLQPASQLFQNYANYQASKTQTQTVTDSRGRVTRRETTTAPSGASGDSGVTPLDIFASNLQSDAASKGPIGPYARY